MINGSSHFSVNGTTIHYSILGNGAPLLITPVTWGVDGHRWTTLDALAEHFTLIRLNPRGTGGSGAVTDKSEYGIPVLVEDIEALRKHLGIERLNVMGQSAGGWTALEYALAHQSVIDHLIIVCSAPTGKFHKNTFRDPQHPLYPQFEKISQEVRSLPAAERVKAFNRAVYQFDVQTDDARRTIDRIFADAEFNAQRNQFFVMNELNRYNVTDRLHEITIPTLVIGGKHDAHVAPEWSEVIAKNIPNSRLQMMQHSGHFPWLDEPALFFELITAFLL
ncbi:MAG: alpha/beta fold hydrolase [Bacteroidota bacterium]